jgi:HEPN domain-containing protein
MSVEGNPAEWIRLAEMDIATSHHMFETYHPKPLEVVCFHAQQAAEKMLKCFLASKNIEIPKIHDLRVLCERCIELETSFNDIYKPSIMLTRYSVVPRYPTEWDLTAQDAAKAIEDADAVMKFIKERITVNGKT